MAQNSGVFNLQQQAQSLTSGQWVTDPYYKSTTLLLHADDAASGAQNNTFVDSSTNAFAITRNGNTTQGTFTPYGSSWSNYFDGTGDYLIASTGSAGSPGTGDFCAEAWIYPQNSTTMAIIGNLVSSGGSDTQWGVYMNTGSNYIQFQGWFTVYATASAPALNTWNHVAVCRSGTTLSLFLNGARIATTTTANNFSSTNDIRIGAEASGTSPFLGNISNARFVKGSSVYDPASTTISVSTSPLTAVTNTTLLTCQSNRFVDNSASPVAVTPYGDARVQRFSPFVVSYQYTPGAISGSAYLDGTGDSLSVSADASFSLTGDFSIETWVYLDTLTPGDDDGWGAPNFLSLSNGGNAGSICIYWSLALSRPSQNAAMNGFAFNYNNTPSSQGSNATLASTGITPAAKQWYHMVVTRSSNALRMFVNGVLVGYSASVTGTLGTATNTPYVGMVDYTYTRKMVGYISDSRVVNGSIPTAYQTSSTTTGTTIFDVPTSPVSAVANTSVLLNYTNASIYDNTMMLDLETVGNTQVSTRAVKYGSGSLAFDGSGDYLVTPNNKSFDLTTGDFTIEGWFYVNSYTATYTPLVVHAADNVTVTAELQYWIGFDTNNKFQFSTYVSSTAYTITSAAPPPTRTWVHFACVRSGSSQSLFLNGVLQSSTTQAGTLNTGSTAVLKIGGYKEGGTTYSLNGYTDDVRITKGLARYNKNFIPPKSSFAKQ